MPDVSHLTVVQDWDEPDVPVTCSPHSPAIRPTAPAPLLAGEGRRTTDILALLVDARDEAADWGPDGPRGNRPYTTRSTA